MEIKKIEDILKYIDEKISKCSEINCEILGRVPDELTDIEDIAHVNYFCGYEKALEDLKNFINGDEYDSIGFDKDTQ